MKKRIALPALAAMVVALVPTVAAVATPGSGFTATAHVPRATLADAVHTNADRIKFQTKGAADVSVVTIRYGPGATTGWHTHPGVAIVAVTQGTATVYESDCSYRTYSAGEVFVESGDDPAVVLRNETAGDVVLTVTFVAPQGAAFRIDHPNPGCAVD